MRGDDACWYGQNMQQKSILYFDLIFYKSILDKKKSISFIQIHSDKKINFKESILERKKWYFKS